jgi:hypothetical protein
MLTIPLPIPVPIIEVNGDTITIDKTATELARRGRERGYVLTFDDEKFALCCACKGTAIEALFVNPAGFRYGGHFCKSCLNQGELAAQYGLIIDQELCEIIKEDLSKIIS